MTTVLLNLENMTFHAIADGPNDHAHCDRETPGVPRPVDGAIMQGGTPCADCYPIHKAPAIEHGQVYVDVNDLTWFVLEITKYGPAYYLPGWKEGWPTPCPNLDKCGCRAPHAPLVRAQIVKNV